MALGGERPRLGYRVPIDERTSLFVSVFTLNYAPNEPRQTSVPFYDMPYRHEDGRLIVETVIGQDIMASVTQGAVADRTTEHLATTDKGIILFRRMIDEQIEKVVREVFSFKPANIIKQLNLLRPIYRSTTNYGHFGKPDLPWEQTNKTKELLAAAK